MPKITRITYNPAGWRKPTGEASKPENTGSCNQQFGFAMRTGCFGMNGGLTAGDTHLIKNGKPLDSSYTRIDYSAEVVE